MTSEKCRLAKFCKVDAWSQARKQNFLMGFSLKFLGFPRKSKNQLDSSLVNMQQIQTRGAVTAGVLSEKVFLEISQNSQENTRARVSLLIKLKVKHRCFPVDFVTFLTFFTEYLRVIRMIRYDGI